MDGDTLTGQPIPDLKVYTGEIGQTRQSIIHYCCGNCNLLLGATVYSSINISTDPELHDRLIQGELNSFTCHGCGKPYSPQVPLVYHHPGKHCFLLIIPESLRHQELLMRAQLLDDLAADPASIPKYVQHFDVIYGVSSLPNYLEAKLLALVQQDKKSQELAKLQEALNQLQAELASRGEDLLVREEDLQAQLADLALNKAKFELEQNELAQNWADLEREREALRVLSLELEAKSQTIQDQIKLERGAEAQISSSAVDDVQPPSKALDLPVLTNKPQEEIDRFRAGDARTMAILHDDYILLFAKLDPAEQKLFQGSSGASLQLWVQYFEFPTAPLIALVAIADIAPGEGHAPPCLFWPLDPAESKDRSLLNALSQNCSAILECYDDEARLLDDLFLRSPLEENILSCLSRADQFLAQVDPVTHDFGEAIASYERLGEERLGKKKHSFTENSFNDLTSPAAIHLALGIIAYWSVPENHDYLIYIKSFPQCYWREIRERVVKRAMEYGLRLSPLLAQFALEQNLVASAEELLTQTISNFAEVSLRIKNNDLDAIQEWENWKLLLNDCVSRGVRIDADIEKLAKSAAQRAGWIAEDITGYGEDLGVLTEASLLPLLTDPDLRRDAALELCERGAVQNLGYLFNAMCNMTRAEAARVIPAMIQLGSTVIPYFIKGLRHRKSYIRQGCALALGAMRAASGIRPLIQLLLSEPTNIWKEAARALGDMGISSLDTLIAQTELVDGEGRERLAWACAQAALDRKCYAKVELLATSSDKHWSPIAKRALELLSQVSKSDQEVRKGSSFRDQTVVRSFSRHFFESLSDAQDPGDSEIVEKEEMLDDMDIIEEEVEVKDEDIINR